MVNFPDTNRRRDNLARRSRCGDVSHSLKGATTGPVSAANDYRLSSAHQRATFSNAINDAAT